MYTARDTQLGISRVFVNYLSIICRLFVKDELFFLKKDESFLFDNCERCLSLDQYMSPGRAKERHSDSLRSEFIQFFCTLTDPDAAH